MVSEMNLQKDYLGPETLDTIYLGGGTPSLLSEGELKMLFDAVRVKFRIAPEAEVTAEVNPDDLTSEKLEVLASVGVNRLSIGLQSFSDDVLQFFNRAHRAKEGIEGFQRARDTGFHNISVDLIYGIPSQGEDQWKETLSQIILLRPEHISAYALTVEENTVFGRWQSKNKLTAMDEEHVAEQFEQLMDALEDNGYEHYEISNFAQPGYHSRHNSSYWQQKKYLGIGPSAHSYNGRSRQFNVRNNSLYIKSMKRAELPFEIEHLTRANLVNEYLLTTLRTHWGCDLAYLANELRHTLTTAQGVAIEQFKTQGFIKQEATRLFLTRKGKLLADKIASDLFIDEDTNNG